ncbi:N-acetylmuramidase domain-containing protein [Chelativorans sp.]|uniref:N-acetylmuramidase domain-containing protein n=1 Tax=Chelativorans sp. TaxID=2203393 RepID=UPI002810B7DA|nr:N-acetylmuramidase domain-containing protein [Chelativorans sp.]
MFSPETTRLITQAAEGADLEPAVLLALVDVEAGGRTHALVEGRMEPLIRFEGHYFDRRLSPPDREIARREGLASPSAGAVKNPPSQAARWRMLARAAEIDRPAAYESTSWGVGQVMGAHWAWLGYASVDALVDEARSGLQGQLGLMLRYILKSGLAQPLRRHDWAAFARGYNGPGYRRKSYHLRLALAYRRHSHRPSGAPESEILRPGSRGESVRRLQALLSAAGYPVAADGIFGRRTREAVLAFQREHRLVADGIVGPRTRNALETQPLGGAAEFWRVLAERLRHVLRMLVTEPK